MVDKSAPMRCRICFLLPSLRRAGAETQVVSLATRLDRDRFDPFVVTYLSDHSQAAILQSANVKHVALLRRKRFDGRLVKDLGLVLREHRPDVLHCTLQNAVLYGVLAARQSRLKTPVVAALHTTVNVDWKHEIADLILHRFLLQRCAWTIFVCQTQRAHWLRRFAFMEHRSGVIYNGVDTEQFRPEFGRDSGSDDAAIAGPANQGPAVCCVAGFRPEKDHGTLLRAFAQVAARVEGARLWLVGDGPARSQIERQVHELGLLGKVELLGEIGDVRPVLAHSAVLVLSSKAVETFSMAMLEAMAMGLPVISTRIGGAAEAVIDGVTGRLVKVGVADELAQALIETLTDESARERMGVQARNHVVTQFSVNRMVEETATLLERVADDPVVHRGGRPG